VPNAVSKSKTLQNGMFTVLTKAQRPLSVACIDIQGPGLCGGRFCYDNIKMVSISWLLTSPARNACKTEFPLPMRHNQYSLFKFSGQVSNRTFDRCK